MVTMEELRTGYMAAECLELQRAVREALEQGFARGIPDEGEEEKEVNLVLQAREQAQKKHSPWPNPCVLSGEGCCRAASESERSAAA